MHALLLMLAMVVSDGQPRWPGFLGAGAEEVAAESLPLTWSATEHVAWKTNVPGDGQSSPVVWNDQIYVTSVEGPEKDVCHLLALRLADGSQAWDAKVDSSHKVMSSLYVSRAAPTPVADEQGVYAFFESGDVLAVSHTGQQRWHRSLSQDYGKFVNKFGLSASPIQTADAVIILVDDEGPSYLVALAKADGSVLWKTDRTSRVSWSSPALVTVGDQQQVVCSSAGSVDGYDPADGKLLWSYNDVGGNTAATPLAYDAGQFLVGASAGSDGKNADAARRSDFAMAIEMVDGVATPKVLWKTEEALSSFGSPRVHAGHAYWVNRSGVVFCFDVATGELRYKERTKQSCWATPLGIGDRVYFFGKDGVTTVLAAGPKFELLAENVLWNPDDYKPDPAKAAQEETEERRRAAANFAGPVQYGVAAVNGSLIVRTGDTIYCLRAE